MKTYRIIKEYPYWNNLKPRFMTQRKCWFGWFYVRDFSDDWGKEYWDSVEDAQGWIGVQNHRSKPEILKRTSNEKQKLHNTRLS